MPAALSELDEILRDLRNYDLPRGPIREKFCRVMIRIGESGMLTDPDILGDS